MNPKSVRFSGAILASALLALLVTTSGCQNPYAKGFYTPNNNATIALTGNAAGSKLVVDNNLSFQATSGKPMEFKVPPGEHRITVEKNGQTVLDQKVDLQKGQRFEAQVP